MGIDFDNVDDDVVITAAASLNITGSYTISAWIKADTLAGVGDWDTIADKVNSGYVNGYYLQITNTRTANGFHDGTNWQEIAGTNLLSTGTWYHVACVFNTTANTLNSYLNGADDGSATPTTDPGSAQVNAHIGNAHSDNPQPFDGIITEVAVWNAVLTAGEIAQLANSKLKGIPLQIQPSALKLYLPMDSGTHGNSADLDTAWDLSGNGNNGNPDNGANNTGLTWAAETVLNYPSSILQGQ